MIIGIPRERKEGERRVAITPDGVSQLVRRGHRIIIESHAGDLSGFPDMEFFEAGAELSASLDDVWKRCELLVKVKEPAPEELSLFRPGLAVFSFLHPAVAPAMVEALLQHEVTGLDYDLVTVNGRLPILEPMSVIAGKLAVQCGAYSLHAPCGGRGVLLGGAIGVPPAKVLVVGAGAAGSSSAKVALGMGADVTILDINTEKLAPFADGHYNARTLYSTPRTVAREIGEADLVIGAVLVPGALAPKLVTREMLQTMKKGAVLVDICIDQGGFAESSRPTSILDPTYVESGVVHYCVPNMPALVPRTSTEALTNATLPWIQMLADRGIEETLKTSSAMQQSLISFKGKMTNIVVGKALGRQAVPGGLLPSMLT